MNPTAPVESTDTAPRGLYRIGGAASIGIALMYLCAMAVYVPAMRHGPTPATVVEWFALLQSNRRAGLFYLGFADIPIVILFGPLALALHAALGRVSKLWTTIATPLAFVGIAVHLATNISLSMLALSSEYAALPTAGREYAAATTQAQRSAIEAAGQAILSISRGTGNATGMSLVWFASLVFSILMLRSTELGKAAAWIGIVSFTLLVPSFLFAGYTYGVQTGVGATLAIVTSLGGGLLSLAWYILVGVRLLKAEP